MSFMVICLLPCCVQSRNSIVPMNTRPMHGVSQSSWACIVGVQVLLCCHSLFASHKTTSCAKFFRHNDTKLIVHKYFKNIMFTTEISFPYKLIDRVAKKEMQSCRNIYEWECENTPSSVSPIKWVLASWRCWALKRKYNKNHLVAIHVIHNLFYGPPSDFTTIDYTSNLLASAGFTVSRSHHSRLFYPFPMFYIIPKSSEV